MLAQLQLGLHGCAAVAALGNSLALESRVVLIVLVLISLALELRRHGAPPRIAAIHVARDGAWRLITAEGREHSVALAACSVSSPWLVWLAWSGSKGRRRLLIFPDSLSTDQFRQLRVALRIASGHDLA
ncbi:MAG: hypothetical protein FIA97_00760 [Methylococcaceae bacterium]|nr:hypothetical protein [Methylococcaceae bacterium]